MKTDVLVIGGSAAGIVAATVGKACYSDKEFLVLRDTKQNVILCGGPYIFRSLENSDKDLIPGGVFSKAGIGLKVSRATCPANGPVSHVGGKRFPQEPRSCPA